MSARELQGQSEIESAMHRIAAWRRPSSQRALNSQPVLGVGHDDDGEKYGGKTLEKVLTAANLEGTLVVARWYGGVLLGPVRFDHMRMCAEEAISNWFRDRDRTNKRRKVQEEAETRERLVRALPERDQSIIVLRGLLAEKRGSKSNDSAESTPTKVPDYASLPVSALERLEHARDATISWVLKEIEKAESAEESMKADDRTLPLSTESRPNSPKVDAENAAKEVTAQIRNTNSEESADE